MELEVDYLPVGEGEKSGDAIAMCGGVGGRAGQFTVGFLANRSVHLHPALRLGLRASAEDAAVRGEDGTGSVHGPAHPGTLAASGKQRLRKPATKNHYSDVLPSALATCGSTLATREHQQGVPDGLLRPVAATVQADRTGLDLPNLGNQGVAVFAGQQVRPGFFERGLLTDRSEQGSHRAGRCVAEPSLHHADQHPDPTLGTALVLQLLALCGQCGLVFVQSSPPSHSFSQRTSPRPAGSDPTHYSRNIASSRFRPPRSSSALRHTSTSA